MKRTIKPRLVILLILLVSTFTLAVPNTEEVVYFYDELGRLVKVQFSDKIIHYAYDDAGNRTGMTVEILVVGPTIASITPRGAVAGGSGNVLRISGSNFTQTSVVQWNGVDRATTFVNSNELQITVASNDLTVPGTASVVVVNPTSAFAPSNAATFSIVQQAALSGRVTVGANGLSGVTVALSGSEKATTTTDTNGFYNFAVLQNGSYTIGPSLSGYTFDPASRNVGYSGLSQSSLDFVGTVVNTAPVTITGRVIGRGGHPARMTTIVTLTDSQGNRRFAIVNMLGNYRFADLPRGGTYTLRVASKGWLTYSPLVVQANDNMSNVDFNPTP